jgi:excisionase family DNA binding protein
MTSTPTVPDPSDAIGDRLAVTVTDACRLLSVSRAHLYRLIDRRELQSYADGKSRRIVAASLRSYLARRVAADAAGRAA